MSIKCKFNFSLPGASLNNGDRLVSTFFPNDLDFYFGDKSGLLNGCWSVGDLSAPIKLLMVENFCGMGWSLFCDVIAKNFDFNLKNWREHLFLSLVVDVILFIAYWSHWVGPAFIKLLVV